MFPHQTRKRISLRQGCVYLTLAVFVALSGCSGDGKYPVTGTVTWEGEPIPSDHNGHVTFMPTDAAVAPDACPIGPDGRYTLRASPGTKKVEILISRPKGKVVQSMGMAAEEMFVPRKYNEETELQVEVKQEPNEFDFHLTAE